MVTETVLNWRDNNAFQLILGGILGLAGFYYLIGSVHDFRERRQLSQLRAKKHRERKEQFQKLETRFPFNSNRAAIVNLSFDDLVERLQRRNLTSTEVLEAFISKALSVTNEFNCITEFIPNAIKCADELDKLPKVKGPLHGVPICVKDDHHIEGMDSTVGYAKNLYKPKNETSVIVQVLQNAGAVPFCKTNLPQTVFTISSDNPIFGTTLNHLNTKLSPGGSSSGTGCLVGAGGAHFGTGSDIAGSLRIPSHFSGISTLRPTIGRMSGRGITQCLEECAGYIGVSGIMASKAKTLANIYEILLTDAIQNKMDPLTLPIPWNSKLFHSTEPLRIGYFTSLPYFPTMGDTPETILKAKDALESIGHTVVPFELPNSFDIIEVYTALADADGGNQNYKKLRNDAVSFVAQKYMEGRSILGFLSQKLSSIFVRRSVRNFKGNVAAQRSEVLWEYLNRQRAIKHDVLDRMKKLNLDLILAPAFPYPASTIEDTETLINGCVYTCTWNLVDFPAGITPFGTETCTKIDSYDDQGDFYLKLAKKGIKLANGMPIGVQVVGKPHHEEQVLRILAELEVYKSNLSR
ncbi:unnamed protein product [Allacma fusca]|uniref:Amidase domain-containing protein n=1 Tax=Allacma fusca TaxID=39272 RepID=A0A8J2P6Y7_9HEXA|nr:unnamed protein product [Allacma fusca]